MKKINTLFILFICIFSGCDPETEKNNLGVSAPVILRGEALAEGYKICFLGDAGTGAEGQKKVATFLEKEDCSRIIYLGDIIYENGLKNANDKQFMAKFYTPYKNILESQTPFYLSMGNHDYGGAPSAWLELAKRYPQKIIFPYYYYAEIRGEVCFIAVDSNLPNSSAQSSWILEAQQKLKQEGCELSLAFAHHPYLSSGEHGPAQADERVFLEANILGKLDAYIAGHDHILSDELTYQDTRLLISGGGGQDLYEITHPRPGVFAKSVPGYIALTLSRSTGKITARYDLIQILNDSRSVIHSHFIEGRGIR